MIEEKPSQIPRIASESPPMDSASSEAMELSQKMGMMRMINWQGSRLISGVELRTVLHEMANPSVHNDSKLITLPDLTQRQNKFVHECAVSEGLNVELKHRTLKISRENIKPPLRHSSDSGYAIQITEIVENFLYLGGARDLIDPNTLGSRNIRRIGQLLC